MFKQGQQQEQLREFWVVATELPAATPNGFYRRVNQTLAKMNFA